MSITNNAGSSTADIHDDDEGLNSSSSGKRFSGGKIIGILIFMMLVICGGSYAAWTFFKGHFSFLSKEAEPSKGRLSWTAPPETIGKLEPTEVKDETKLHTPSLPQESATELTPPPLAQDDQLQVNEESGERKPTLKEMRLASSVATYNAPAKPEIEERKPSRQVKLMREIDYTLIKGTKIPCTLETNIISEQQGFTSCIINQDVYSGNARILLIEKGTKVTGEYNGDVKNGAHRIQIIWDRLITPYDIVVQLDSPVTDRLGASGISGKVDNRWGTRIGSALLVSMISDALKYAGKSGKNSGSNNILVESETADTGKDIAVKILDNNINLPPVIYIQEGAMLNIYVADDIDMSRVYRAQEYGK